MTIPRVNATISIIMSSVKTSAIPRSRRLAERQEDGCKVVDRRFLMEISKLNQYESFMLILRGFTTTVAPTTW